MASIAKGIIFLFLFAIYFVVLIPIYPLFFFYPQTYRKLATRFLQFMATLAVNTLCVKVEKRGIFLKQSDSMLMVGNHMSYLDVIIIASVYPSCFVTSVEVRDTFFLGHLCKLAGCVFVERRSRQDLGAEVADIKTALLNNLNVVFFPEATSTNGEQVKRFKRPLFQAAIDLNKPVLPICLNYKTVNYAKFSSENRDRVCWYGDMDFLPHFISLLQCYEITCEFNTLSILTDNKRKDTTELAAQAYDEITAYFRPVN